MTARIFAIAQFPGDRQPHAIPPALVPEAQECATVFAWVAACTRSHAVRLWYEGREAIRGMDGKLECFGILMDR